MAVPISTRVYFQLSGPDGDDMAQHSTLRSAQDMDIQLCDEPREYNSCTGKLVDHGLLH
jgi:hypothetical protein